MSRFETNLRLLRQASEPLAARMEAYHELTGEPTQMAGFSLEPSRSGVPTVRYSADGQSFFLHSPYDPLREAEQFASRPLSDETDANFAVFFGMGLGYGVLAAIRNLPADNRVFVFEPHWELFYLAFCQTDLSPLLTRPLTTLTCEPSVQGAMMNYLNLFELAAFRGVRLISNPVFDRLPQANCFTELAQRVRYEMTVVSGNVQTLMVMGEMQQTNIILNFPHILDNPPFRHLLGKFPNRPAVVVSAGPSLEKNVDLLREIDNRALIIAVDTATKPLLAHGISPHVVVTGDPQEANYRHLKGVDLPGTYLITEPQCPIATMNSWTGPKFICSFHDNAMQWVDRVLGDRGRAQVWGSVAVMAYDVAVKVGADPIVFIGQDLSFPGGRTYASGTFFETEDKMEMTVDELAREGAVLIDMVDIYGEPVKTNRQMFAYFNFLKSRFEDPEVSSRRIVNATEGGILQGPHIDVMPLREAIDRYMPSEFDVRGTLGGLHALGNELNLSNTLIELDTLIAGFRDAYDACAKGLDGVRLVLEALAADDGSLARRREIALQYNRMVSMRKAVNRNQEAARMIEMANQTGIYSFAQGVKGLNAGSDAFSPERLKSACYHYHTLYLTTRDAIARLIPPFEAAREAARDRARSPVTVGA
jgi:hypothetical protein